MLYLISAVVLVAGCGARQAEGRATPTPVLSTTAPTPGPLHYSRDYWPTEEWKTSPPEAQGMDAELLGQFQQHVEAELSHIYSVLIVRNGYLVFEQYYQGYGPKVNHDVYSVTKSLTSALIGIALQEGYIDTLDQKVIDLFPEYDTPALDAKTRDITLRHLLTMSAGFEWSDQIWTVTRRNPIKYALARTMAREPGQQFNYDTPAAHILSGVLTKATGMTALEFADQYLFEPLGISSRFWAVDPQGNNFGSHTLSLPPRDMAKFGFLYLNYGYWDGQQIIPAEFVAESTGRQIIASHPADDDMYYGYLWWVTTVGGHPSYFAAGFGGQLIYVVPELDLVVVTTSKADRERVNSSIIQEFIMSAVLE